MTEKETEMSDEQAIADAAEGVKAFDYLVVAGDVAAIRESLAECSVADGVALGLTYCASCFRHLPIAVAEKRIERAAELLSLAASATQ